MASVNFKADTRIGARERALLRNFCNDLGSDLVDLSRDLGLKLFEEDLLPYESGYLEYDPTCGSDSDFKIVVNRGHSVERQRFTVAHEIAHFLLHKQDARKRKSHRTDGQFYDIIAYINPWEVTKEQEANAFAAHLLMPQNLFRPAYVRLNGDINTVAQLFGVSVGAAERRVKELGIDRK